MKKVLLISTLFILLVAVGAEAIGICTTANTKFGDRYERDLVTCTASASDGSFPASLPIVIAPGYITRIVTDPSGDVAPQDAYDISLVDSHALSIATLTNRATATTEEVLPTSKYIDGTLAITITNNNVNSAIIVMSIYSVR